MNPRSVREFFNAPLPINLVYWAFLLVAAVEVSPMILFILLVLPGFVSRDRVTVTEGPTTVEIEAKSGSVNERHIRQAVKETRENE